MTELSAAERDALARLDGVDPSVLDQLVKEFEGQNDRSAVVVGAAQLDALLADLLDRFLLPNRKPVKTRDDDSLLGRDRPLSTFSARIASAYRLGLIGEQFAASLDLILKMRNTCAHNMAAVDLSQPPHRDRVAELCRPIPSPTFWKLLVAKFGDDCPASHFRAVVVTMSQILLHDLANVTRAVPQPHLGANFRSERRP